MVGPQSVRWLPSASPTEEHDLAMPKTIPRIGRQDLLKGIEKLAQIVHFRGQLTEKELREEMEAINHDRDSKLFKSIDSWLRFTLEDENRSIEIIKQQDDYIELTKDGLELLNAPDFRVAAFQHLEGKSRTNFTYFYRLLQELDRKVQTGNYDMGTNLTDTVNSLMKDTMSGNKVTAGAIACLLRDFEVVIEEDGRWLIDPAQYTYFRGEDAAIVEDILAEHGNRMDLVELQRVLTRDLKWSEQQLESILQQLQDENRAATDRYEGKTVIELVTT